LTQELKKAKVMVCGRLAQLARAPALQAGGHRSESCTAQYHQSLAGAKLARLYFLPQRILDKITGGDRFAGSIQSSTYKIAYRLVKKH
jgi:hypothetical protein